MAKMQWCKGSAWHSGTVVKGQRMAQLLWSKHIEKNSLSEIEALQKMKNQPIFSIKIENAIVSF